MAKGEWLEKAAGGVITAAVLVLGIFLGWQAAEALSGSHRCPCGPECRCEPCECPSVVEEQPAD